MPLSETPRTESCGWPCGHCKCICKDGKGDAEQCHHALRAAHDALEVLGHYVDSEYAAALAMADVDSERPIPTPMRRDMQDLGSSLILAKREITVLGKMLDECALQCKLPAMPVG